MYSDEGTIPSSLPLRERTALRTALDLGYFEVPRRTTLSELADALETTDVEASRRVRNGMASLLRENRDSLALLSSRDRRNGRDDGS
jgi:hypothetical protein